MTQEQIDGAIQGMIFHSIFKVISDSKHNTSSIENTLLFANDIAERVFKGYKIIHSEQAKDQRFEAAKAAMQGICAHSGDQYSTNYGFLYLQTVAENAVAIADALIVKLNKPKL